MRQSRGSLTDGPRQAGAAVVRRLPRYTGAILLIALSIPLTTVAQPMGTPGEVATYRHARGEGLPRSVVKTFTVALGPVEERLGKPCQWLRLRATKAGGEAFSVWIQSSGYPAEARDLALRSTARYLLQEGDAEPLEFRHRRTKEAVLPALGAWPHLFPRPSGEATARATFAGSVRYLGHPYLLQGSARTTTPEEPPAARLIELLPDLLTGVPSTRKQRDPTRRYDRSDYEYVPLTKDDYHQMIDAGMTCLRVDAEAARWIEGLGVFYWGVGGADVRYPECLYRSSYLGPNLFLDEPAVVTRDHVIRPKLEKDAQLRRTITPRDAFDEFKAYFHKAKYEHSPTALVRGLAVRPDVDLGDMEFLQENLYTWETMVSSGSYQLTEGGGPPPAAIVWEPPGRVGTRRTLPEMNMTYGCQIPVDDPKNLTSIIYGFLRGAARAGARSWGMSIYGAVDRADAFWFQTHAYDLGATHFFYWDNGELACVPYDECLALTRNLRAHAAGHPRGDLEKLKRAAEVLIVLPRGYNLGHVHMGKGSLWGIGELHLERLNGAGVTYREVMRNVFIEVERCLRLGVAFDLLWDLEGIEPPGYREVVRVREDDKVEVEEEGTRSLHDGARTPVRPAGAPPRLTVELSDAEGRAPLRIEARARVVEGSAPVYYTLGADTAGVYRNAMVAWELYGPGEEDYRFLGDEIWKAGLEYDNSGGTVLVDLTIARPGRYRLRAATVDIAGRTAVAWKDLDIR